MTTTERLITQEEHSEDGSTAAGDLRSETPAAPALDDVMRWLRSARKRVAEIEARTAEQIASLRAEVEEDCKKAAALAAMRTKADREAIEKWEALATAYLAAERALDPKVKHVDSVWGRVGSRDVPPTVCWPADDAVLLGWAETRGFVNTRTVTTLDKKALKEACRVEGCRLVLKSGGIVPYVEIAHNGRTVTVETIE